MPVSFSFSVSAAAQNPRHDGEESPTARRELQLLEDHRPWEMLDNMVLAIIDQTYTALLEILHLPPPPPEGDGHVSVSQFVGDSTVPDRPMVCVEASARHCCVYVMNSFQGGVGAGGDTTGRNFTKHAPPRQNSWLRRHRLVRAGISASLGALYLARVDGGCRGDYWKCADEVRPDVAGRGLLGVLDAIRSRLDAAARLEARLLEIARAYRCRGPEVREIFRAWMALEDMRREVDLDVIVRRRFQKRPRVMVVEMDVDREDEAEEVTKRLKALHV